MMRETEPEIIDLTFITVGMLCLILLLILVLAATVILHKPSNRSRHIKYFECQFDDKEKK